MMEGFGEIMTFEETAKYLTIGTSTLYKMAREGKISVVKIKEQNRGAASWTITKKENICLQ